MRRWNLGSILIPTLLVSCTALLYLSRLENAPLYLNQDEVFLGLTAHSIASSGRDLYGRFMPLYFNDAVRFRGSVWWQPMLAYSISTVLRFLPFSESAIRLPAAMAGIIDVVLIYFIGRHLFRRKILASAGAFLLASAPAHFMFSRAANEHVFPLPFTLGWLLCLLISLQQGRSRPTPLFAAGFALGIGLYTYLAAYLYMPIYALLTCLVLRQRKEPWHRYGVFAVGFLIPASVCVLWLMRNPTVYGEVTSRYWRIESTGALTLQTLNAPATYHRIVEGLSAYVSFWSPHFLFISGPPRPTLSTTGLVGIFLLPVAGLLCLGLWRSMRYHSRDGYSVLLMGGLLTAPVPASFVGESQAVFRALEILPFGVLVAVYGLEYLWIADNARSRRAAFLALWAIPIVLTVIYHADLPEAQALLRACSTPLAVTGLAVLLRPLAGERLKLREFLVVSLPMLLAIQVVYLTVGYGFIVQASMVMMGFLALAPLLNSLVANRLKFGPAAATAVLATIASAFMFFYVDYSGIHQVRFVPARVIVSAAWFMCTAAVLAAAIALIVGLRRVTVDWESRKRLVVGALVASAAIQSAYYYVDYFSDGRARFIQAAGVLIATISVASFLRRAAVDRLRLGQISLVTMLVVGTIQFATFYTDYIDAYQRRVSVGSEGNTRIVWEAIIERARTEAVPAIYMGKIGPYGKGDLLWTFYLIKHNRLDLLKRTNWEGQFDADRVRELPPKSIVATDPSDETDRAIRQLAASGEVTRNDLLKAPDGTPIFWILERSTKKP